MGNLLDQIKRIFQNVLDMPALMEVLKEKEITTAAFIALALIVFTETGLLIGFFLPGDSLLITAGIVARGADWPVVGLILLLCAAAIIGDTVGYWIGAKGGAKLYDRKESFFFRKSHMLAAQAFYEKHGGKTIILARFMPFIRTFAPVVAGVAKMDYRRFLMFNVVGGVAWVVSMVGLGYVVVDVVDPPLQAVFGPEFKTAKHIEKLIIVVVFLSIAPGLYAGGRAYLRKRAANRKPAPLTPVRADYAESVAAPGPTEPTL